MAVIQNCIRRFRHDRHVLLIYKTFRSTPERMVQTEVSIKKYYVISWFYLKEELEDAKEVIRIRLSKKNTQHNDQKKKYKRTNYDLQNIHIKLKIE